MLTRLTISSALPVPLDEMKEYLRIDHDDEDRGITAFIRAAASLLDGSSGLLGYCLLVETWRLDLDDTPSEILLPLPLCRTIETFNWTEPDGTTKTLEPSDYRVTGLGTMEGTRLLPVHNWPKGPVSIVFTTGLSETPDMLPEPLRMAIKLYVMHLYERRSGTPDDFIPLIANYRTWSF